MDCSFPLLEQENGFFPIWNQKCKFVKDFWLHCVKYTEKVSTTCISNIDDVNNH